MRIKITLDKFAITVIAYRYGQNKTNQRSIDRRGATFTQTLSCKTRGTNKRSFDSATHPRGCGARKGQVTPYFRDGSKLRALGRP